MNKVDEKTRWQYLRSRAVGNAIYEQLPMLKEGMCRRMLYAYRRAEHRVQRPNLNAAVRATIAGLNDRSEIEKTRQVMMLFDHGPLDSELWVAIDPSTPIEKAASRWNVACMKRLRANGFTGSLPKAPLSERVEKIRGWRSYIDDDGELLLLSQCIIKVRATFLTGSTAMKSEYKVPIPEEGRGADLSGIFGRPVEAPLFSTATLHRKQTEHPLIWAEDGRLSGALFASRGLLERFGISEVELSSAIEAVVTHEKRTYVRRHFL